MIFLEAQLVYGSLNSHCSTRKHKCAVPVLQLSKHQVVNVIDLQLNKQDTVFLFLMVR